MSKFTKEMVEDYANKLLIGLTEKESDMVLNEFDIIDKNIDIINTIPNIEQTEPMPFCLDDFETDLREDVIEDSVEIDELLQNCDETNDREVEVIKVVGWHVHGKKYKENTWRPYQW